MINQFEEHDHWHCLVVMDDTGRAGSQFACPVDHKTRGAAERHWRSRPTGRLRYRQERCEEIPVRAVVYRCQRERAMKGTSSRPSTWI